MGSQLLRPLTDRDHCQVCPLTLPSPSSRMVRTVCPTCGSSVVRVRVPSSSTSITVIVMVAVASITGTASTLPSASLPSCSVALKINRPPLDAKIVSKSNASTVRSCPLFGTISKYEAAGESTRPKVRLSLSRSDASRASPTFSPAAVSGIDWPRLDWPRLPVNLGGALTIGSAVTAAVASLCVRLPDPRRSI